MSRNENEINKIQFLYHDALVMVRVLPCCLSICQQRESEIRPISIRSLSLLLSLVLCFSLSSLAIIARDSKDVSTLLYFSLSFFAFLPLSASLILAVMSLLYCTRSADQSTIRFSRQRASISGCAQPLWRCHYSTTKKRRCSVAFVISFLIHNC